MANPTGPGRIVDAGKLGGEWRNRRRKLPDGRIEETPWTDSWRMIGPNGHSRHVMIGAGPADTTRERLGHEVARKIKRGWLPTHICPLTMELARLERSIDDAIPCDKRSIDPLIGCRHVQMAQAIRVDRHEEEELRRKLNAMSPAEINEMAVQEERREIVEQKLKQELEARRKARKAK